MNDDLLLLRGTKVAILPERVAPGPQRVARHQHKELPLVQTQVASTLMPAEPRLEGYLRKVESPFCPSCPTLRIGKSLPLL